MTTRTKHTFEIDDDSLSKIREAISEVGPRSSWSVWAHRNGVYLPKEELAAKLRQRTDDDASSSLIVVDTRDEDACGGKVRGAVNLPDSTFDETAIASLLSRIDEQQQQQQQRRKRSKTTTKPTTTAETVIVVFHCMESIMRGPRCARRFVLALEAVQDGSDDDEEAAAVEVRVLDGGADRWIRSYWLDEGLVEAFDDDYWGFAEQGGGGGGGAGAHMLYERPADQPEHPRLRDER